MPTKGTRFKYYQRYNLVNHDLWRKYKKETKDKIPYTVFLKYVTKIMSELQQWTFREPIGFRLPEKTGYMAINKFKARPEYKSVNYITSIALKKPVYNQNLHTNGYMMNIKWFKTDRSLFDRIYFYYFDACRNYKRGLAKFIKTKPPVLYNQFINRHFRKKIFK